MYNGKMETIYESEYMNLYDLQYREGGHYYCASRRNKDRMVALTPDEECGTMQPDAVSCFVVLNIKGQPKKLLLNWEYRYPVRTVYVKCSRQDSLIKETGIIRMLL